METPREGRQSFRIDDDVSLRVRRLSEEEFRNFQEGFPSPDDDSLAAQLHALSAQSEHVLAAIRSEHPAIARYLRTLDKKLELIARHVEGSVGDLNPDTRVNLGTGGLAYWSDVPLPVGTALELRMVLFPALAHVRALGRVVHSQEDLQPPADQRYRVGVEFELMAKGDHEALARHLLELQCAPL